MRTYGSVTLSEDLEWWIIERAEPHVSIRLKQIFPRIPKAATPPYRIQHNPLADSDIDWFMQRYPLDISKANRRLLTAGRDAFLERQAEMERILLPNYVPVGSAALRDGQELRPYQWQAIEVLRRRGSLLLGDEGGLGKAQPLTARVLTTHGWKAMGDINVGDEVLDPDGGVGAVTAVFDRGILESYRITLSDGASTECCDEHLWLVQTDNDRFRRSSRVLPLKAFKDRLVVNRPKKNIRSRYFIPCGRVDINVNATLAVNPYLLGA